MVDRIRKLSKERGKTIKDLEKECGIGNGSIAKWDDHCPRVSAVVDVARALDVSLEVILGYGEKEEREAGRSGNREDQESARSGHGSDQTMERTEGG